MRVLVDARFYVCPPDGITRYVKATCDAIGSIPRMQLHAVVSGNDAAFEREFPKVPTIEHDVHPVGISNQLRVRRLAAEARRFDIYHYPHFDYPLFLFKGVGIMTVHDLKLARQQWESTRWSRARHLYFKNVLRLAVRRARAITVPSEYTKRDLVDFSGIPAERVFVTYHPLPRMISAALSHRECESRDESFEEVGEPARFGSRRPFLLYVGTDRPNKNLVRLLEAYASLVREERIQHDLYMVGVRYSYRKTAVPDVMRRVGLNEERVRLLGSVSDRELVRLYEEASALVMPSTYEGFGIPVLEAMALGTPVVTSNVTSLPEVAGDAAIYADPFDVESIADGIARVLTDEILAARMVERGRRQASTFTLERFARGLLSAYRYAVGERGGSSTAEVPGP